MATSTVIFRSNIPVVTEAMLEAFPKGLLEVGKVASMKMTEMIDRGVPPPNAQSTIDRKGSSQTLVASGEMYDAIDYELRDNGTSVVAGVMGSDEANARAWYNEFGTDRTPSRPFVRPVFNDKINLDEMNAQVKEAIRAAIKSSVLK